jgi:hypothetical protein
MKWLFLLPILFIGLCAASAQDSTDTGESETDYSYADDVTDTEHTAREPEQLTSTQNYRSQNIKVKKFDQKKWKEIVGSTDFEEEKVEEKEKKIEEKDESDLASGTTWNSEGLKIFVWIIVIAFIVVIIYFIVRNFSFEKKLRKEMFQANDPTANVEEIDDLDINYLLQQAIKEGNLRMTIRLYYLRLLQSLQQKEVIVWKKDKTNNDYLTELFSKNFHFEEVRKLTLAYEQIWYGEYDLTPEIYNRLVNNFESIQQNLNTSPTL